MKPPLVERIVNYLREANRDVKRIDIQKIAEKYGYSIDDFYIALEVIAETHADIAQWKDDKTKVNYVRYYEPNELTKQVQECLDRGDDW